MCPTGKKDQEMTKSSFKIGAVAHFFFTFCYFITFHYDNSIFDSGAFIPIIGWDENYWLNRGQCYLTNPFLECFVVDPNLWPILISFYLIVFDHNLWGLVAIKAIIYVAASIFIIKKMSKVSKPWLKTFFYFLCFNPYVIMLHNSLMRDDLILALVLCITGYFWSKLSLKGTFGTFSLSNILLFCIIVSLFFLRPAFGIISVVFLILKILSFSYLNGRSFAYKVFSVLLSIVIGSVTIFYFNKLIYILNFSYSFDLSRLLRSFYEMFYSPLPKNILNGSIIEIDSGVSGVWVYALVFPTFSIVTTLFCVLVIISKIEPFYTHIRENFLVVMFAVALITPYILSTNEVQGPRQSIASTTLLFYIFGLPLIIYLGRVLKLSLGQERKLN